MNKTDGSVTYRTIDSVYSDGTVTYTRQMPAEILTCTEVTFGVSAMNTSGYILEEFMVSSCKLIPNLELMYYIIMSFFIIIVMAPTRIEFPSSAINTSVLYKADGSFALVEVHVRVSAFVFFKCTFITIIALPIATRISLYLSSLELHSTRGG